MALKMQTLGKGIQIWRGYDGYWDPKPSLLDNWISNDNVDINKL